MTDFKIGDYVNGTDASGAGMGLGLVIGVDRKSPLVCCPDYPGKGKAPDQTAYWSRDYLRHANVLVLDADDEQQIREYIAAIDNITNGYQGTRRRIAGLIASDRVENFRKAILEIVKPHISEPTLWGVVHAGHASSSIKTEWVHTGYKVRPWRDCGGRIADWSELVDPVLVREGVES